MTYMLSDMLAHRARLTPDKAGFIGPGYRYDYRHVDQRCSRLAAWFQAQGVAVGDRVAVYGKNSEALATALYAASRAGAIVVVLNWRLQVEELAYILRDSGARGVVYDAAFSAQVDQLRGRAEANVWLRVGEGGDDAHYDNVVSDLNLVDPEPARRPAADPAIIMYTSGTTGRPKGAVLSHANFLAAAHGTSCTIDWRESDRFLLTAPMFHIGGLMPLTTCVQKGSTVYFQPDFDPAEVFAVIAREAITNMMSVPVMLDALLRTAAVRPVDHSSLVNISCGASTVPPGLIEGWRDRGVAVQQVYGLTEVTGALSYWTAAMDPTKAHSHGKPAFLNEVQVVDPDTGRPVVQGDRGEVWCRGACVFSGYWNNPEATAAALSDGWFRTGDVGYFDGEGFLYLVDRLKDVVISGGENVYPAEVEAVLSAHAAVAEAAVIGVPDEKWGEVPLTFVVLKPDGAVEAEDLIAECRRHLAAYKCPRRVLFVDTLPRSAVGKVLKPTLREIALEATLS